MMHKHEGRGEDAGDPLAELHAMSTPRARLRSTLQQAALLERAGSFEDAAHYWLTGLELASRANERHWCEVRALLCQKRGAALRC
ncbi:TPA: ANR family transcriptional regulator [Serratia marcescens]|nr:ANR family transcriptional regulator [Serratia marcescens]